MTNVQHQWAFLRDVAKLIQEAERLGYVLTGGELYRADEMQRIYFQTGKTKTMNSQHLKRLAIDFNFFIDGVLVYDFEKIKKLGDFWICLSSFNRWGGDFNKNGLKDGFIDTPHFERFV